MRRSAKLPFQEDGRRGWSRAARAGPLSVPHGPALTLTWLPARRAGGTPRRTADRGRPWPAHPTATPRTGATRTCRRPSPWRRLRQWFTTNDGHKSTSTINIPPLSGSFIGSRLWPKANRNVYLMRGFRRRLRKLCDPRHAEPLPKGRPCPMCYAHRASSCLVIRGRPSRCGHGTVSVTDHGIHG